VSARILVAGVGNVFFGDDGFGPAVAQRLREAQLPAGVEVREFGIRGIHLAYELLDGPDLLVVADAVSRGGEPGTLYVLEPELDGEAAPADAHGMDLRSVFAAVAAMGGRLPRIRIVGCEPASVEPGMELSAKVANAVDAAARLVREIVEEERAPQGAMESSA
jgi:hydrogenase maturation protease